MNKQGVKRKRPPVAPRRPEVIAGWRVAMWESESEAAEACEVDVRTLLGWRERGCPYHRDPDGSIWYPVPHSVIWRQYWIVASEGLRVQLADVPLECALAWRRFENARAEYLYLDDRGRPLGPDESRVPPEVPRWRPNDWADRQGQQQTRAGRHSYTGARRKR